jgi:DNA-binding transcriptional regulator WhiA
VKYKDELLGTLPDTTLAELTGKHVGWIYRKRINQNIPSYRSLFGCLPRCKYDIHAFSNINSVSAYWLGFYFADGCVCKTTNSRHIVQMTSLDKEVIDKLNAFYGLQSPMCQTKIVNNKNAYTLQLCNKKLFNRLYELGCVTKKSNILGPPFIEEKFYLPFILGYFDGDGCVSRNSTINSWKVSIGTGGHDLFEWITSIIKSLNLAYSIEIKKKKNYFYNICLCGISGKVFLDQLYSSVPEKLPLSRKKQRFLEMSLVKFRGPKLFDWEKEYIFSNRDNNICSSLIENDPKNYGWKRSAGTISHARRFIDKAGV